MGSKPVQSPGTSAKAELRKLAAERRDRLEPSYRAAASAKIAERALAIVASEEPRTIAAYMPIGSECDPRPIIDAAIARRIVVALPSIGDPASMDFRRYAPGDELVAGGFGTLAPSIDKTIADPDLVIVPLIAFDRSGSRLGHGRGFYDRAVAVLNARGVMPKLVGIGFATQEVEAIPAEPHDARLDWIVTENETLDLRRSK
jgi:5-formyltetrahydrofolate cyclo-ligase